MAKLKEYRIKQSYFNIILTLVMLVVVIISVGIASVIIGKIKEKDKGGEYIPPTTQAQVSTTPTTEDGTTDEYMPTIEEYYALAMESFSSGEYIKALDSAYRVLDGEIEASKKEEIIYKLADVYVAANNHRAAYYLLQDCNVDGLLEKYCKEKTDLKFCLTKYTDPNDKSRFYMGYYPQTGYHSDELPEYVTEAAYNNDFARIYGVEYTRLKVGGEYMYFVSEPVKWWIIKETSASYTVVTDKLIDCKPFHNALTSVTWDTSALKIWTNTEFFNKCFNEKEAKLITEHTTPASWNYYYEFTSGKATKDKVGIIPAPSLSDATHIFKDHDSAESKALRKAMVTDYAGYQGAFTDEDGYGKWWTATAANKENWYSITVSFEGSITVVTGGEAVNKSDICVRPYMTIKK